MSVVTTAFTGQAEAVAKVFGVELAIAEYPGVLATDTDEVFASKISMSVVDGIVSGLSREQAAPEHETDFNPNAIVVRGDLDQIQNAFEDRLWTDGLPIIPPTQERVRAFLAATQRDKDQRLGVLLPSGQEATVWNTAVNGVMAGCPPSLMPVLIATVEAIADPVFRLEDAGSTPGWEPLIIVSGPVVTACGFNHGAGVMRSGRRANTSLGRFLRLYMRNVAGLRIPPGETDKGCIGMPANVALAEDAMSTHSVGWLTLAEERGFARDDSVVTVQSNVAISAPIYSYGNRVSDHLEILTDGLSSVTSVFATVNGLRHGTLHPLLVLSPAIAAVLGSNGIGKDEIRSQIARAARMPLAKLELYGRHSGAGASFSIEQLVAERLAPACYLTGDDGCVPVVPWPENIEIVVAGDPGRNQSRAYVNNHMQGPPVSRRVGA